jgi:hypothetical protein
MPYRYVEYNDSDEIVAVHDITSSAHLDAGGTMTSTEGNTMLLSTDTADLTIEYILENCTIADGALVRP